MTAASESAGTAPSCLHCCYFREHDKTFGSCHRFPPQFGGDTPRDAHRWRFPLVFQHAWCGEFRALQVSAG